MEPDAKREPPSNASRYDEGALWNSGSFSGEFNPGSLVSGMFQDASLGSLGSLGPLDDNEAMAMDVQDDDLLVEAPMVPALPLTVAPPRVSVFPDHPGPTLPLKPQQFTSEPLTPAVSVSATTMTLLNKVYHFQSAQRENLAKLRLVQVQVLSRPTAQAFAAVASQESKMKQDTWDAIHALISIYCNCLLSPIEIARWQFLWADLHVQLQQIDLFLEEIHAFSSGKGGASGPNCALVIVSQPFPVVATRGRTVDGLPMTVQLLTGATVDVLQTGTVRAEAVIPKGTKGKLAADLMDAHTALLAPDTYHADFRLKFANGTRKQPVFFQFHVPVNLRTPTGAQQFDLSSTLTRPTISVTNEVQWEEAEGILIERMAFENRELCQWFCLANHLQRHIIEATRQSLSELQRIFGQVELTYFHRTFFSNGSQVTVEAFREFWKWYGKAAHKIRYTKHVLSLFLNGHLFGFIAKQDMEKALLGQPPGAFMVRFSERNAGSFSIAYVLQDADNPVETMVRHYLVSHEDITQRKSLADFIGESPALTHFLRYDPSSGFSLAPNPMGPGVRYQLQEKHLALADYYAKREVIQHTSGYDSQLNPQPPLPVQQLQAAQGHRLTTGMGRPAGETSPSLAMFRPSMDAPTSFGSDGYWDAE